MYCDQSSVFLRERNFIDPHLIDGAVKAIPGTVAGADSQRLFRLKGIIRIVQENLHLLRPAVRRRSLARALVSALSGVAGANAETLVVASKRGPTA